MRRRRGARGFTLVEVILALAIVGALLVVAFGGLRVAVSSWRRGDERTETQQHLRTLTLTLSRAIGAAYPYAAARQLGETPVILFKGEGARIEFVTQASPFPAPIPIAFTAVVIEIRSTDERPKLVIRQRVLPNQDPFIDSPVVLEDELVKTLEIGYLGDGGWQSEWDPQAEGGLPRAVRIGLAMSTTNERLPSLTVPLGAVRR